jgi:hypothetical protein
LRKEGKAVDEFHWFVQAPEEKILERDYPISEDEVATVLD